MTNARFSRTLLDELHQKMARHVGPDRVPGLVLMVSRDSQLEVEAFGTLEAGGSEPMRRDALFRISSMTKPITAAATLKLVDEGKLKLDESVDRLLPELSNRRVLRRFDGPLDDTVPACRPITVRDLLTFRMGFGQVLAPANSAPILQAAHELAIGMGPPRPSAMPASDEWLRRLGTLPLMAQPGERWHYNTASDVLGVLIARASGRPFPEFLREQLFDPLGMRDTGFSVPENKLHRLATSYWTEPVTGAREVYDPARGGEWGAAPVFPSGAAGLVSTADDYLAFARMLLSQGRHEAQCILSPASVAAMTTDQLSPAQKAASAWVPGYFDQHGWGFGVSIVTGTDSAIPALGYGWDGGLGTSWRNEPHTGLVTLLMTQQAWTSPSPPDVCRDFWASASRLLATDCCS